MFALVIRLLIVLIICGTIGSCFWAFISSARND